jgi:DNA-binding transcriptional regulator of glucitol operon
MTNLIERSLNFLQQNPLWTKLITILIISAIFCIAIAFLQASEITFRFKDFFEIILKR